MLARNAAFMNMYDESRSPSQVISANLDTLEVSGDQEPKIEFLTWVQGSHAQGEELSILHTHCKATTIVSS